VSVRVSPTDKIRHQIDALFEEGNRHVPSVRLHRAKASTSATQSPPYAVGNQLARSRIVVLDVGHSRGQRVWAHADTTLSLLPLDAAWRVPP